MRLRPCIPDDWPGFQLHYRLPDDEAIYEIEVRNPERNAKRVAAVQIDEREGLIEYGAACIPIVQDGARHEVVVTLAGALSPPR